MASSFSIQFGLCSAFRACLRTFKQGLGQVLLVVGDLLTGGSTAINFTQFSGQTLIAQRTALAFFRFEHFFRLYKHIWTSVFTHKFSYRA